MARANPMTGTEIKTTAGFAAGYRAGRNGAALHDESNHGRLWLAGADRVAFLQRMTTNDVRLQPGQGTVTVLTSPTARIVCMFTVLTQPEGLLLLAGPDQGAAAYNALRSQIFFGDQVTLEGRGSALAQMGLYGPQAAQILAAAGLDPEAASLQPFAWREVQLDGRPVTVQANEGLGRRGYTLLADADAAQVLRTALLEAGAMPLPEDAYQVLRVEAGVPAPGYELTDRVSPLEAGLRRFCNDHKGCYTGQEIIARQITYDKVTTHLVGLLPFQAVPPEATVEAGGRQVGYVTSSLHSVARDRPVALAYVRRPHHEPGTQVTVVTAGRKVPAQVVSLPLVEP